MKQIITKARQHSSKFNIARYLRIGYARINIYSVDLRKRDLGKSGIINELLCTIQVKILQRIKSPDIIGGIPELSGNIKIVWNSKSNEIN